MDALREAIYLVANTIASSPRHCRGVPCTSITPQSSPCCQIQRLFEYHDERKLYTSSITTETGHGTGSPVSSSSSTSSTSPPSSLASSPAPNSGPDTFTLFSQLPMEIRVNVWRIASQSIDGRVIPIEPDDAFEDATGGFRCRAKASIPSLLLACSDSRNEALHFYTPRFQAQLRRPIYFNGEKDILFMSRTGSMYSFLQSTYDRERRTHEEYDRNEVLHLALLVNDIDGNFWGEDSLHGYSSWRATGTAAIGFANLLQLRLVYRRENNQNYTPQFQSEKVALASFWTRHWSKWQTLRARALWITQNLVVDPRISRTPEFVFWSREELGASLPTLESWRPENFQRRSRGSPEPLYARTENSFFQGIS